VSKNKKWFSSDLMTNEWHEMIFLMSAAVKKSFALKIILTDFIPILFRKGLLIMILISLGKLSRDIVSILFRNII